MDSSSTSLSHRQHSLYTVQTGLKNDYLIKPVIRPYKNFNLSSTNAKTLFDLQEASEALIENSGGGGGGGVEKGSPRLKCIKQQTLV